VFDLFVSDRLPDKVMSDIITAWMKDFSDKDAILRAMGVRSLAIRPVMFGFMLEARFGDDEVAATRKEVKDAVLEPVT